MHVARALTELQEHDLAILRLEKELEEMPEKRAILTTRAKIAEIENLRERTQARSMRWTSCPSASRIRSPFSA